MVEKEEAEAQKMALETRSIAEDAERDLAEALPALEAAVVCLNKLRKADIDEVRVFPCFLWCELMRWALMLQVRSMNNPPTGVKLTMQATCIMFGIKPLLHDDREHLGKKTKDWWSAAQRYLLQGT